MDEEFEEKMAQTEAEWSRAWPEALRLWSPYVILRKPVFYHSTIEARKAGIQETIAQISMADLGTSVDLQLVSELGLEGMALPVLAHEIGHHVLCPGSLVEMARMIALIKPVFNDAQRAGYMENLYGDLLINDRLYRSRHLPIPQIYKKMVSHLDDSDPVTPLWTLYMRVYETLWQLPKGFLASASSIDKRMDLDAGLAARIIKIYSANWYLGLKKIAYVFLPYFPPPEVNIRCSFMPNLDSENIGDLDPAEIAKRLHGLIQIGEGEEEAASIGEGDIYEVNPQDLPRFGPETDARARGQVRTPAQYGQVLEDLGLKLQPKEAAVLYYSELALPELIPFPTNVQKSGGTIPEGALPWELGDDLDALDWNLSLSESPVVFPGLTTRQVAFGEDSGDDVSDEPINLDLYIDCSGSMPNPHFELSYLTLAGVIMTMSALRAGAKVQVTLWSSYGTFKSTHGFIDDEQELLGIVTDFISGATGFPLNILRETYLEKEYPSDGPPAHIMVISDDGVDTMLQYDEFKTPGWEIVTESLKRCRGGGTLVLNIPTGYWNKEHEKLGTVFDVFIVRDWVELREFAAEFSKRTWSDRDGK
ncbi:MAG: VWA domain-containing protein [Promethearchaeota archaeon]